MPYISFSYKKHQKFSNYLILDITEINANFLIKIMNYIIILPLKYENFVKFRCMIILLYNYKILI